MIAYGKGCGWILTGIEILSRFAFLFAVEKKDSQTMLTAVYFKKFIKRFGKFLDLVQLTKARNLQTKKFLTKKSSHCLKDLTERFNL